MVPDHKVWNKTSQSLEKGVLVVCPKCRGRGTVVGDNEDCFFCDGHGEVVQSKTSNYCRCLLADEKESKLW